LYLHLGIGRGVEHNGHQRFLFNVYKRFLFLSRFFTFFNVFLFFLSRFFTSMVWSTTTRTRESVMPLLTLSPLNVLTH